MPKAATQATTAPRKRGPKPMAQTFEVTTVRLRTDQWEWLKRRAFDRALHGKTKPDASAVMRELVDRAMKRKG